MAKLILLAVSLAVLAASTGHLPRILKQVRVMQVKLIRESQASKWPKAMLLHSR